MRFGVRVAVTKAHPCEVLENYHAPELYVHSDHHQHTVGASVVLQSGRLRVLALCWTVLYTCNVRRTNSSCRRILYWFLSVQYSVYVGLLALPIN
jgi:hypothetical protein